jgi:prepilin-type processing-associated H-X9-DG protein
MPHPTSRYRRGWTWVELILVLAVIAVILALALPFIQQARESARRTQCRNNLKQLGLALHNYHDNCQTFPPGFVLNTDGSYLGWSWGTFTLPYLDASPVYNQIYGNFHGGLQSAPRFYGYEEVKTAHLCSSDWGRHYVGHVAVCTSPVTGGIVTSATLDVSNHFSRSNYFGVIGYLPADVGGIAYDASGEPAGQPPLVNAGSLGNIGTTFSVGHRYCDPANFRGVFGQNSWTKIADIKDGLSHTLIVGERYTPRNEKPGAVGHGTWVGVPDCSTAAGLAMALGDTAVRINAGAKTRAETTGFGSAHTGGSHFLFADGAVKFLSETTDMALYRDLSTIADGRKRTPE